MNRVFVSSLLLALAACAHAQTTGDFAYRVPLAATGDGAFFRIEVPAPVHEGAVRSDLGDLRVFNGEGAPVPYAFLPPPSVAREAGASAVLPLFPLRVDSTRGDLGDVSISVQRNAAGTRVDLSTRDGKAIAGDRLAGYLMDASDLKEPLAALTLPLPAGANVNTRVRVDASDDLSAWRTVAANAPLVDLEYAGRRLTRDRVELPRTAAKYLRLTFESSAAAPEIATVRGEFADKTVEAPRQWRESKAVVDKERPGEYEFDLGGTFPVDRVTLELPEINSVAPAQIFVRPTAKDEWRSVGSAVFYRLRQYGGEVTNPAAAIGANDRYWKVKVDPRSGGLGSQIPQLSVGWYPRVIVFAARGNGPFELAYGSAIAKPAALAIETLIPGYDRAKTLPSSFPLARTGAPNAVPASAALKEPIDTRRWLLWGSLVLAALVLGAMAVKLSKQMSGGAAKPKPAAGESAPPQ